MAIDPVIIQFAAHGVQDISRATATISEQLAKFEQRHTNAARKGTSDRKRLADEETREKSRAAAKVAKEVERAEREKTRIVRQSSLMAGRYASQLVREEKRAEDQKKREVERAEAEKDRIRRRSSEMAGRYAVKAAAEEQRAAERTARTRSRVLSGALRGGGTLGRLAGGAASLAGATLGIGGGIFLADAARQQMDAQRTAALLINTVTTGKAPPKGATLAGILGQAGQVSSATGLDKNTVLEGALEYSRKARGGDFGGSMANMGFFAKMAQVTGADIKDVAGAAGLLQSQNQSLKAPEMQQMLLDIYAQGKAGSMSMVDVAKQVGVLSAPATSFAGNQADQQRRLLALGQLAAPQGTVEEAGTFIKDLVSEAASHRKSTRETKGLEAMGVKFDKYGRMESPEQMITSVMKDTGGDITKIEKIFGKRGTPLFRALLKPFTEAGGGAAGLAKVSETMASVTGATMTPGQLEAQHQVIMDTPAQKFSTALERARESIEARMEPAMEKFADKLSDPNVQKSIDSFIDGVASVAKFMTDNPFAGIGGVVAAAVAGDIAKAAIGQVVASTIARMMAPGAAGAALGGGASALKAVAPYAPGLAVMAGIRAIGSEDTDKAIATGDKVTILARKAELEKKISETSGSQANFVTRGINAAINPAAKAIGFDVFEKQLERVNVALRTFEEQTRKASAVASNRPVQSNAPVTSIGQRPAM